MSTMYNNIHIYYKYNEKLMACRVDNIGVEKSNILNNIKIGEIIYNESSNGISANLYLLTSHYIYLLYEYRKMENGGEQESINEGFIDEDIANSSLEKYKQNDSSRCFLIKRYCVVGDKLLSI